MNNDLEFPDSELPNDDPDIVLGMQKLLLLREHEEEIPDLLQRTKRRPD
ncbi:hypothetical protein [Cryobacterium lyxosi]|nr:hypothetical protein [Cryobacterium lyxosi]